MLHVISIARGGGSIQKVHVCVRGGGGGGGGGGVVSLYCTVLVHKVSHHTQQVWSIYVSIFQTHVVNYVSNDLFLTLHFHTVPRCDCLLAVSGRLHQQGEL